MNNKQLIEQLSQQPRKAQTVSPTGTCLQVLALLVVNLAVLVALQGVRHDMLETLTQPLFLVEMFSNTLLVISAAYSASLLAYPDRNRQLALALPLGCFILYSAVIGWAAWQGDNHAHSHHFEHGIACSRSIAAFTLLPAIWLAWQLRQLATTAPALLGGMVLFVAAASGCLGVRLVEHEAISSSFLLWHYMPLCLCFFVGYFAGRNFFRW